MKRFVLAIVVTALAGCGGAPEPKVVQPHLPHALATQWRAQADAVAAALAAGDGCEARRRAAALQATVIDAVNRHRVPPRFQETLLGSVTGLAARIGCTPPPPPTVDDDDEHGQGHAKHGHGHGKHKK